jgi:hypothetical protein
LLTLSRLLSLLALLGATAWVSTDWSWKSGIASITAFAAFLGLEYKQIKKLGSIETDRKLFREFLTLLPSTGAIDYIRNREFLNPFQWEKMRDLETFSSQWDTPEREFFDKYLEREKRTLHGAVTEFLSTLKCHSF